MGTIKITSPLQKVKGTSKLMYQTCNMKPNKIQISNEKYYIDRFLDFMNRHMFCKNHIPPQYYYGTINTVLPSEKDLESSRIDIDKAVLYWIEKLNPIGFMKINQTSIDDIILTAKRVKIELEKYIDQEQKKENTNWLWHANQKVIPYLSYSYGYKYCVAFGKILKPYMSNEGKLWVDRTLINLQLYMEQGLIDKSWISQKSKRFNSKYNLERQRALFYDYIELDNVRFKEFAFATHPDAYLAGGLSVLLWKWKLKDLILIMLTPDFIEWTDSSTREQAMITIKGLLKEQKDFLVKYIDSLFN